MAHTLTPIVELEHLIPALENLKDFRKDDTPVVLTQSTEGFSRFVSVVFEGLSNDGIAAQVYDREPEGRGAHFDVYEGVRSDDYPWIAIFNLAGNAALVASVLPNEFSKLYEADYLDPRGDDAYQARRNYSQLALNRPGTNTYEARLGAMSGLIIPQTGIHVIHDVVPASSVLPGRYIKLVAPNGSDEAAEVLEGVGYKSLDDVLVEALAGKTPPSTPSTTKSTRRSIDDVFPKYVPKRNPCTGLD